VGRAPDALAVTPDGRTLYVAGGDSDSVTPVSVGRYRYPVGIAVAPAGSTAVVLDGYAGRITLIDTRTDKAAAPIRVGKYPVTVAFAAPFGSHSGR
jgi:YVTN family beta-propeller protein